MNAAGYARFRGLVALLSIWGATAGGVCAAPLQQDLGGGLQYFRVHAATTDLPVHEADRREPSVLDLRFATADQESAQVVMSWLLSHAQPRNPVFVLINGESAKPLLEALKTPRPPGVILIGAESASLVPDIVVRQTAEEERRAYDALEKGATVAALTVDNPDKQRNDEASLSKDRPLDPSTEPEASDDGATAEKKSAPPVDAALQRAIHLHRALRAMKRI